MLETRGERSDVYRRGRGGCRTLVLAAGMGEDYQGAGAVPYRGDTRSEERRYTATIQIVQSVTIYKTYTFLDCNILRLL